MHHAAWLAIVHQVFVVVTDAPPHQREDCPEGIDFHEQVMATLASGASIWVVSDWLEHAAATWAPFADHPGFRFVALADLRA